MSQVVSHDISDEFNRFLTAVSKFIEPSDVRVALEIGSRDGLVSLALQDAFPNAQIFAFECNPAAVEICKRNLEGHSRISLEPFAVTDSDGDTAFFAIDPTLTVTPHHDGNIGASSLYRADPNYPFEQYVQNEIVVQATKISTWAEIRGVPKIDVVWMDVQGAELPALRGFGRYLGDVSVIYTELEYKPMYVGQSLAPDVRAILRRNSLIQESVMYTNDWFGNELFIHSKLAPWRTKIRNFFFPISSAVKSLRP